VKLFKVVIASTKFERLSRSMRYLYQYG